MATNTCFQNQICSGYEPSKLLRSLEELFKKIPFLSPSLRDFDPMGLRWDLGTLSPQTILMFNRVKNQQGGSCILTSSQVILMLNYLSIIAALSLSAAQVKQYSPEQLSSECIWTRSISKTWHLLKIRILGPQPRFTG